MNHASHANVMKIVAKE